MPVAAVCGFFAWRMLTSRDTPTEKRRIDFVGLALLIVLVGAMQIMLDKGRELDWFASPFIVALAVVAAVGLRRLPDLGADRRRIRSSTCASSAIAGSPAR